MAAGGASLEHAHCITYVVKPASWGVCYVLQPSTLSQPLCGAHALAEFTIKVGVLAAGAIRQVCPLHAPFAISSSRGHVHAMAPALYITLRGRRSLFVLARTAKTIGVRAGVTTFTVVAGSLASPSELVRHHSHAAASLLLRWSLRTSARPGTRHGVLTQDM